MKNDTFIKAIHFFPISGILFSLVYFSGIPHAYAGMPGHKWEKCYSINLRKDYVTFLPKPFISYVVPLVDFNRDGWRETVLKLTLNNPNRKIVAEAARFEIKYDGIPTGMTVDIGDSSTNDGFSGDSGSQSNDAEIQIGGLDSPELIPLYDDLLVAGKDGLGEARGTGEIATVRNIVKKGETVSLTISNERINYKNKNYPLSGEIVSPWLYALKGQPDTEGPINQEIYAAFNRVINGNYRSGSGVGNVKVCLIFRHNYQYE